ncbi:efflux transporter outer membrane subunit [Thiomicrorhabdus sp.]|uniref:efflux transporter outer membrane subunit n=1 Tax=Thiomicrorhabdus sp. TaxID=2039724 RepID=UPI0029C969D1|nr:efflux transporter outer membrane subunit [Thiomicrorhabdus sp.]
MPTQWVGKSASVMSGQAAETPWWVELKDPELDRLIKEAIEANPDALSALSAIREARAYRKQADAALLPTLKASGGISSSYNHDTEKTTDSYSAVLDAAWEPDIFGANQSALSAAQAQELASQADYADVLISLSAEVATNYIALRNSQAQLQITEESLRSWEESVQLTVWQEKAGIVTQLDVEQAKRSYEQTLATIPSLRQSIVEAQYQLAVLLGQQPENLPQHLRNHSALPASPESVFLPLPANVLRQRPDVRAAEQRVVAAMAKTDAARANQLPGFSLGGSLGLGASNLSDLFSVSSLVTSLSAGVVQTPV